MTTARDMYEFDEDEAATAADFAIESEGDAAGAAFLLSDDEPFDEETSAQQIAAIQTLLGKTPKRVVELGCGAGRMLIPLAAAGHRCTGIDNRADALTQCEKSLKEKSAKAELVLCDFLRDWPGELNALRGKCDAALCVGNTFMTIVDVDEAARLLVRVKELLNERGIIIIDAIAQEYWPELAEGNWQAGVSEDEKVQMVWAADDAVFALRLGAAVDCEQWELQPGDRKLRLWTMGCLRLAGRLAGLSGPERLEGANALVFRRCK